MTDSNLGDQRRSLGQYIRSHRTKSGLTQTQLGRAVGVDQTTVSSWETGSAWPSAFDRLADALGVSFEELVNEAFGLTTQVEKEIVRDELLTAEQQEVLLAVYGVLTRRDSVEKGRMFRRKPDDLGKE